jgi:F-type H+-transporting ATPase subunit delta
MGTVDLRYARALAAVAQDSGQDPEALRAQLDSFAATLNESSELREALSNPSVPEPQKLGLLDALAARLGMSGTARNFVAVVSAHGRLSEFPEIMSAFASMADVESRIAEAEIVTARPLDDQSRQLLLAQVSKLAGGDQVRAVYSEDASLLGGAVVRLGSTVYDGSLRAQLERMKQQLVNAG